MPLRPLLLLLALLAQLILVGTIFKLQHWPQGSTLIALGLGSQLCFLILALPKLMNAQNVSQTQKLVWLSFLLFLSPLASLAFACWHFRYRLA